MTTKWPRFDNNTAAYFSLRFIIDNEQDFVFPESTILNGKEGPGEHKKWMLPRT